MDREEPAEAAVTMTLDAWGWSREAPEVKRALARIAVRTHERVNSHTLEPQIVALAHGPSPCWAAYIYLHREMLVTWDGDEGWRLTEAGWQVITDLETPG